jgi:hypothetical protein
VSSPCSVFMLSQQASEPHAAIEYTAHCIPSCCLHALATNLQCMCASCTSHATKLRRAHAHLHSLAPLFASQTPLGSSAHLRRLQHREM